MVPDLSYPAGMTEICRYSMTHQAEQVPAVTVLDCGPAELGLDQVPACEKCRVFFEGLGGKGSPTGALPAMAARRFRDATR